MSAEAQHPFGDPVKCRNCGREVFSWAAKHQWVTSRSNLGPACSDECLADLRADHADLCLTGVEVE
jgi:hypothetical protein